MTFTILSFCKNSAHETNVTLSSSFICKRSDLEERIDNVIDVQFLHGCYKPIRLLYEPVGMYTGRIAVRQHTCSLVAVSHRNTQQRAHPVIRFLNGLPFDCSQLLPVSKPIKDAFIYVNQGVSPYDVNSIADTNFQRSKIIYNLFYIYS